MYAFALSLVVAVRRFYDYNLCIFFLSFCRATDVLYELAPHGTPGVSNQPLPTGEREPHANIVVTPQWVQRCIQVPRRTAAFTAHAAHAADTHSHLCLPG